MLQPGFGQFDLPAILHFLPEQAVHHPGAPSMGLAQLQRAAETIIRCALLFDVDIRLDAGREC